MLPKVPVIAVLICRLACAVVAKDLVYAGTTIKVLTRGQTTTSEEVVGDQGQRQHHQQGVGTTNDTDAVVTTTAEEVHCKAGTGTCSDVQQTNGVCTCSTEDGAIDACTTSTVCTEGDQVTHARSIGVAGVGVTPNLEVGKCTQASKGDGPPLPAIVPTVETMVVAPEQWW